jgi:hypothetical protein
MMSNLDIYTDKLGFKTFLLIIYYFFFKEKKLRIFFYTKGYSFPFYKKLNIYKNIKLIDISNLHESRYFINNKSIFQLIWIEIDNFFNNQIKEDSFSELANLIINKKKINKEKLFCYFKENSVYFVYYQIKLYLFSKKFSKKNKCIFFFKKNPFNNEIEKYYNIEIINYIDLTFFYKKRIDSSYYENYLITYLFSRIKILQNVFFSIRQFITGFFSKKISNQDKKIFIEVHQREINFKSVTDFFWLKDSKLKKNAIAILYKKYKKKSIDELNNNNITYKYYKKLHISKINFLSLLKYYSLILINLFNFNLNSWKKIMIYFYFIKTTYWYEVFKSENAKIFFTMIDIDEDKFCKLDAIELNNGISITSHWSNFPFLSNINKKAGSVVLTWGDHYKNFIFNKKLYQKIYNIGYPNDHYFNFIEKNYSKIENKNKFIITYMDNNLWGDGFNYPSLNIIIMNKFIDLLNKYENLIIYLKPKSKFWYKKKYTNIKNLEQFIKKGKIKVLFNEGENEKFTPAAAAAMSDLCIGLGISTASSEAIFFGVPAFHFDNHNLINDFTEMGKDKIIFNKVNNLFKAIEDQIRFKKISIEDCKKISYSLDCFQDRKSSLRAESIISFIFDLLVQNENPNEILNKLDIFIRDNSIFKKNLDLV